MSPPKVVLTRLLPPEGARVLALAVASGEIDLVQWEEDRVADRSWLMGEMAKGGVVGLLGMFEDKLDAELIAAAGPLLRTVSTMSAGLNHVDLQALESRGISLGSVPDCLTDAVADVAVMLTLAASRRLGEALRAVIEGRYPTMPWSPLLLCGHGLQKATVGIIGFGKIGQATLHRLLGFGISRALYTTSVPGLTLPASKDYFSLLRTPSPHPLVEIRPAVSLTELAEESDFVILACGLTPETHHLVDGDFLKKMKKKAYVINVGRGACVDEKALLAAVAEGRISGAGLDVVEGEPNIPSDHPLVLNQKIVLTPHVGSSTMETRGEMAKEAVENLFAGMGLKNASARWANQVPLKK